MLDSISDLLVSKGKDDQINIDILLFGSPLLCDSDNIKLFGHVQLFIAESKRFI